MSKKIPVKVSNLFQDVIWKCKISGLIVADPGTSTQTLIAYDRGTGEQVGSTVWDPITKTYVIFMNTAADGTIMLTRKDETGLYFAETYDHLSLCNHTFVHGSEYDAIQGLLNPSIEMGANPSTLISTPVTYSFENLYKNAGTLNFTSSFLDGIFKKNSVQYPLPKKVRGSVLLDNDRLTYSGNSTDKLKTASINSTLHTDPFGDGSLMACYPLSTDGKDITGNYSAVDFDINNFNGVNVVLNNTSPVTVPILITRAATRTIVFTFHQALYSSTGRQNLINIPGLLTLEINASTFYIQSISGTTWTQSSGYAFPTWILTYRVALVVSSTGNDKLFTDSVSRITKAVGTPTITNSTYLSLDGTYLGTSTQRNYISNLMVFNRELTTNEMTALSSASFPNYKSLESTIYPIVKSSSSLSLVGSNLSSSLSAYFPLKGNIGNTLGETRSTIGGVTSNQLSMQFNGSSGCLYRGSTKGTVTADCNVIDESNMDGYIRFQPLAVNVVQCLWKSGDHVNGIAFGIDASGHVTVYVRNSSVLTSSAFTYACVAGNWYRFTMIGVNISLLSDTNTVLETKAHGLTIPNSTGQESVGAAITGSPISGASGDSAYFNGYISDITITDKNTMSQQVIGAENTLLVKYNSNEIPVEVVKFDMANNEVVLWAKLPEILLSTDTVITVEYGTTTKSGLTGSALAQKVWDDDYVGVYHMIPGSSLIDSTGNHYDGTLFNLDSSNFISDLTGHKLDLNGTDEYVKFSFPLVSNSQRLSISALLNADVISNGTPILDLAASDSDGSNQQVTFSYDSNSDISAAVYDNTNTLIGSVATSPMSISTDYFTTLNYNGKTINGSIGIEVDGTVVDTDTSTGNRLGNNSNSSLFLGKDAFSGNYFNGKISELLISKKQRSVDWNKVIGLSLKDLLGSYSSITSSGATFTIPSATVAGTVSNVPIMLRLSTSSGISLADISPLFTNIKSNFTSMYGTIIKDYSFGSARSGISEFNPPVTMSSTGPRYEKYGSMYFNGTAASRIDITNSISRPLLAGTLTVSLWIDPQSVIATGNTVIFGVPNELYVAYTASTGFLYSGHSSTTAISTIPTVPFMWTNIIIIRDKISKLYTIYQNGVLCYGPTAYTTQPTISETSIYIGGDAPYFNGKIADIKIFNRVLTASEIQDVYKESSLYNSNVVSSIISQSPNILLGDSLSSIQVTDNTTTISSVTTNTYKNGAPCRNQYLENASQNTSLGPWSSPSNLIKPYASSPLYYFGTAVIKNRIYIFGGYGGTDVYSKDVISCTINTDGTIGSWNNNVRVLPYSCEYTLGTPVIIGAYVVLVNTKYSVIMKSSINEDGTLGSWTSNSFASMGDSNLPSYVGGYYSSFVLVSNGYIYICGGINSNDILVAPINNDGSIGMFSVCTNLPGAVSSAAFIIGSKLYVCGWSTNMLYSATILSFGMLSAWTSTALPFSYSAGITHVITNGRVYLFPGAVNVNVYGRVYSAPISNDVVGTFTLESNLIDGTTGISYNNMVVVNNYLYSIGNSANQKIHRSSFLGGKNDYTADAYSSITVVPPVSRLSFYALSSDGLTYKVNFSNVWKSIASSDPTIHEHVADNNPYYWDNDSQEWVYANGTMEEAISKAIYYPENRMDKTVLNALTDFSSVYSSSIGTYNLAVTMWSDGTTNPSVTSIKVNNKNYWLSEIYNLPDYCVTVTSASVDYSFTLPDSISNYKGATKIYALVTGDTQWTECVNGTIPNVPTGLVTSGKTVQFRLVWDLSVWTGTPADVSIEVTIK